MRGILDKTDQRVILILEKLTTENSWITVKEIADYVDSSVRTVTYDLSAIKNNWNEILDIETSINYGIKVNNKSIGVLGDVLKDIFRNSPPLNLFNHFFIKPWMTKEEYCKEVTISPSLFFQYLKRIRATLNTFGADIKVKQGKYYIYAENEVALRSFMASFLIERHRYDKVFFSYVKDFLLDVMTALNRKTPLDINNVDIEFVYLYTVLEISLIRENQGFESAGDCSEVKIDPDLLKKVQTMYPNIKEDGIKKIDAFFNEETYVWSSDGEEERITKALGKLVEEFFLRIDLNATREAKGNMVGIIRNIYVACKAFNFEPSPLLNRDSYFVNEYKKHNQQVYNILAELIEKFSKETNVFLFSLLDSAIFWLCIYDPEFLSYKLKKKLLVVSDLGPSHCNMIKYQLEKRFNLTEKYIEIECITYGRVKDKIYGEYDLVITTMPIDEEINSNILIINDNINYRELHEIEEVIYKGN